MRQTFYRDVFCFDRLRGMLLSLLIGALSLALPATAKAQSTALEDLVSAVVRIKTFINPDGSSVSNLGREREGSGIVIDESGLVLTIGYLMVEAHAAEIVTAAGRTLPATVVGYDQETGFGLLRTLEPPKIKPLPLGRSADLKEQDPVLVSSFGGTSMVLPARVVSRRVFAGSWEYLVEGAIFTSPPHPTWSGSALINREGKLVGVGSLIVGDSKGENEPSPGNMFVPIDLLPPIMGDLLSKGRIAGPGRPWLGVNAQPVQGKLVVGRVRPESPAGKAGLKRGDVILGIGGVKTGTLAEFYQKLWTTGDAGVTIPLDVESGGGSRRIGVPSVNRLDTLKLQSTF
jgi:S1-C subfamily serine protease